MRRSNSKNRLSVFSCKCFSSIALLCTSVAATAADPDSPGNLRFSVYSGTAAEVFWDRAADDGIVVGYEILVNDELIDRRDALSYFMESLTPGESYEVTVTSIDNDGDRSLSSSITFIAGERATDGESIAAPTGLRSSVYSSSAAAIAWDRPDIFGLTYEVSRDGLVLDITNGVSYVDDGLSPGTDYTYSVIAIDLSGERSSASTILLNTSDGGEANAPDNDDIVLEPLMPPVADNESILEPSDLYVRDGYDPVDVIRVDLRTETSPGPCNADDESGCTLADVLADVDKTDDHTVDIAVHFQSDDFPDDGSVSNAELRLRGGGSRFAPQKSFRIKLDSKKDLWRDERYLQLNKHPFESSRVRNKLAMDLMSQVPNLPSLRTQFVNLWIDDGEGPVDYGLYTHVERVNENFLTKRDWDDEGNLYKADDFRFDAEDLEDIQVDEDGEPISENRFESVLGIENGEDHRLLVAMMTALNDPTVSFESVLEQYFDRNNVLAWVGFNILFHQADISRHNYILYNPTDSQKFYFVPWDYDAAMGRWNEPPNDLLNDSLRQRLEYGYAVAARNIFLTKFYQLPGIHAQIVQTAESLAQRLTTESILTDRARAYVDLAGEFERQEPDSVHNPGFTFYLSESLITAPEDNLSALQTGFGLLMAPIIEAPSLLDAQWNIAWSPAYDVTGESGDITYTLQIADSPSFEAGDIVVEIDDIDDSDGTVSASVNAETFSPGDYYARVIAVPQNESDRNWQVSGNKLIQDGTVYYGAIAFTVE